MGSNGLVKASIAPREAVAADCPEAAGNLDRQPPHEESTLAAQAQSPRLPPSRSRGFVWPQTYVDSIQCSNASLCAGGLNLTSLVNDMIEQHLTELSVDESCDGSDGQGPCSTRFTGRIRLSFID